MLHLVVSLLSIAITTSNLYLPMCLVKQTEFSKFITLFFLGMWSQPQPHIFKCLMKILFLSIYICILSHSRWIEFSLIGSSWYKLHQQNLCFLGIWHKIKMGSILLVSSSLNSLHSTWYFWIKSSGK